MTERFAFRDGKVHVGDRVHPCAFTQHYTMLLPGDDGAYEVDFRLVFVVHTDNGWCLCLFWGDRGCGELENEPERVEAHASWLGWETFRPVVELRDQTPAQVNELWDRMGEWEPGVVGDVA